MPAGAVDSHRAVHSKPATIVPSTHPVTVPLVDQAAPDEDAEKAPATI